MGLSVGPLTFKGPLPQIFQTCMSLIQGKYGSGKRELFSFHGINISREENMSILRSNCFSKSTATNNSQRRATSNQPFPAAGLIRTGCSRLCPSCRGSREAAKRAGRPPEAFYPPSAVIPSSLRSCLWVKDPFENLWAN